MYILCLLIFQYITIRVYLILLYKKKVLKLFDIAMTLILWVLLKNNVLFGKDY